MKESPLPLRSPILTIQALRFLAALMVVIHHATYFLADSSVSIESHRWPNGAGGVDIFFLISGFIMPLSIRKTQEHLHDGLSFLKRRAERIYPLFWICTTVKIVTSRLVPSASTNGLGSTYHIIASYLLLPSFHPDGAARPLLAQGWTLIYEMMFYLLIALALVLDLPIRRSVSLAILFLTCSVFIHLPRSVPLHVEDIPRALEFIGGMFLAWQYRRGKQTISIHLAYLGAIVSFVTLCVIPSLSGLSIAVLYGIPSFVLVYCMLNLESSIGKKLPRWLLLLGDASYSIYLTHEFCLLALVKAGKIRFFAPFFGFSSFVISSIALSLCVGLLCYLFVERPINQFFHIHRKVAVANSALTNRP